MAAPSEATIQAQFGRSVEILDQTDKFLRLNAKNIQAMYDGVFNQGTSGLDTDYAADVASGADAVRAAASALVDLGLGTGQIDPHVLTYGGFIDAPTTNIAGILERLYQHFKDNALTVQSRGITFGTVAAVGSPAGDGIINRLTKDRGTFDLEAITVETKVIECIGDANSGVQAGRETFEIAGGDPPRDFVSGVVGPQRLGALTGVVADDSTPFVANPTFAQFEGTGGTPQTALTLINGWSLFGASTLSNFQIEIDPTKVYRASPQEGTTPGALRIDTSAGLFQKFSTNNARFNPALPYYVQVAVNASEYSGVGGSFRIKFGNQEVTTLLSGLSAGWNVIRFPLDDKLWFENFNEQDPGIEVEWVSATSGSLLVDDICVAPMTLFDGTYWAAVGGATPWLFEDKYNVSDTLTATEAIIQYWLWRMYGFYLPHSGTPTWPEPT